MSAELRDAAPDVSALDAAEPPALAAIPSPPGSADSTPAPARKSRSGTSGAERRRRAAGTAPAKPKPDRAPAAPKVAPLAKRLAEALDTLGTLVATFVDPYDGAVLSHNAERAGEVLAGIAARKPAFGRMLERFLGIGDNIDGMALLAGMALPILVHHGVIPAKFGVLAKVMDTAPPTPDLDAASLRDLLGTMGMGATVADAA